MTSTTYVDREVLAVLRALEPIRGDSRLAAHLRLHQREFDWRGALDEGTWSSGEAELIRWAGALWTGTSVPMVDVAYLASSMSDRFRDAVLAGIAAYAGRSLPAFDGTGAPKTAVCP